MKIFKIYSLKKTLKYIYQFFLSIYVFEFNKKLKKIKKKSKLFFFVKSFKDTKNNKIIKKYFEKDSFKLKRFKKNSKFLGLKNKSEIICSGWIFYGNTWNVEEIDKKIKLKKQYLLYDFFTSNKFRNKGYYQILLKMIINKYPNKKLIIYSLSKNIKSIKAIRKVGFKLIKKLNK